LAIKNNSIQHNGASGIAVQFYTSTKNLGNLIIAGNKLVGNNNYGIDCKAPSGGKPQLGYWSGSVNFGYNVINNNNKGRFSKFCQFSKNKKDQATLSAEEIKERMQKKKEEAKKETEELERKDNEKVKREKEEAERKKQKEERENDLWDKNKIVQNFKGLEKECYLPKNNLQSLAKKNKWKIFFFGPDEKVIKQYEEKQKKCEEVISKMNSEIEKIKTKDIQDDLKQNYLKQLQEANDKIKTEIEKYKNKFGLWSWVKRIFGK